MHISSHPKHSYPMRLTLKNIAPLIIYFQQKNVYGMSKLNVGYFLCIQKLRLFEFPVFIKRI